VTESDDEVFRRILFCRAGPLLEEKTQARTCFPAARILPQTTTHYSLKRPSTVLS